MNSAHPVDPQGNVVPFETLKGGIPVYKEPGKYQILVEYTTGHNKDGYQTSHKDTGSHMGSSHNKANAEDTGHNTSHKDTGSHLTGKTSHLGYAKDARTKLPYKFNYADNKEELHKRINNAASK